MNSVCRKSCYIKAGEACPQMPPCEKKNRIPLARSNGLATGLIYCTTVLRASKGAPHNYSILYIWKVISKRNRGSGNEVNNYWTNPPLPRPSLVHVRRDVAAVVGVLWLSWLTLRALKALTGDCCAFFLAPLGISRINLKEYGSWAGIISNHVVLSLYLSLCITT